MSHRGTLVVPFAIACISLEAADRTRGSPEGDPPPPSVIAVSAEGAEASWGGSRASLRPGGRIGPWTLLAVVERDGRRSAVLEDFTRLDGRLVIAGPSGLEADLTKTAEPIRADRPPFRGHSLEEVLRSEEDLLGREILERPGDPDPAEVAAALPPISKMYTSTFIGTDRTFEKVGFEVGGRSPNFDPAVYVPAIEAIRKAGRDLAGLAGGWLPALRFVYPEEGGAWTELVAFAPFRTENGNDRVQPVWYRVARVEGKELRWARYFDSYHPFPPRGDPRGTPRPGEPPAASFYADLLALRSTWAAVLGPAMSIDLPDRHLADQALHGLIRERMTRAAGFPKYGVFDRGYGGSEHDGFPDTFTVATTALVEWGLTEIAGENIENYFERFVRDDGSILYRGPEIGQFGRMLTVAAAFADHGGDEEVLLQARRRLDAVARLLLSLRAEAAALPAGHPARGMISGWSEADACLDPDPGRYMQPYFSNSTEAWRGFRDLGAVWERIGRRRGDAGLEAWGRRLGDEARALAADLRAALDRAVLRGEEPPCLPAIAGVREPFHVAVARDRLDPQFRSYRAWMEMLWSGCLTREEATAIARYRSAHKDAILGIPTCYGYGTGELAVFLSYGHGFGLLQHDLVREYLLLLYGISAHGATRGTWTAPETRLVDPKRYAAPYCVPAQLVVPLLVRWMLVFEDPADGTVWLAKGTPRSWLEEGRRIAVKGAPVRGGRIGYAVTSRIASGEVEAVVDFPAEALPGAVKLRLRTPGERKIREVLAGGKPWSGFDPAEESVTLPAGATGGVTLKVRFGP
jgi:hypothetical protein